MVFCNKNDEIEEFNGIFVTILILVDGFLQLNVEMISFISRLVTILILVDGFLQYHNEEMDELQINSHNPYFSRWFSAILEY